MPKPSYNRRSTLEENNDPCSVNYMRYEDRVPDYPPSESTNSSKSSILSMCRLGKIWKKKLHKSDSTKSKSSSFVMPYDKPQELERIPSQSSVRSRLSTKSKMTDRRDSMPSISVTRPSMDQSKKHFRVHSYGGPPDTSATKSDNNVRFSHPTVNAVRPTTPGTLDPLGGDDGDDAASIFTCHTNGSTDALTDALASPPDGQARMKPKSIWRNSGHFNSPDGNRASFHEFKDRLDGHKLRSETEYPVTEKQTELQEPEDQQTQHRPAQEQSPSLQYIPHVPRINLDEPVMTPAAQSPPEVPTNVPQKEDWPISDHPPKLQFIPHLPSINLDDPFVPPRATPFHVQQNRDEALKMLQGGGVLAVLPKDDMPSSGMRVLSRNYPSGLKPNRHPVSLQPSRPFSYPAAGPAQQEYQAFSPRMARSNTRAAGPSRKMKSTRRPTKLHDIKPDAERSRLKTPDAFADFVQHKNHYSRVESGEFDSAFEAFKSSEDSRMESGVVDSPYEPYRPSEVVPPLNVPQKKAKTSAPQTKTPDALTQPTRTKSKHLKAEATVDSNKPLPPTPTSATRPRSALRKSGGRPDTPIPGRAKSTAARKSARLSAGLPARPDAPIPARTKSAAQRKEKDKVPSPHTMMTNGYPVMSNADAARYQASIRYKPRTMDELEKKYQRDLARKDETLAGDKLPVKDKKTVKLEKQKAELERKIAKQKAKIAAKQLDNKGDTRDLLKKQQKLEESLRKLM